MCFVKSNIYTKLLIQLIKSYIAFTGELPNWGVGRVVAVPAEKYRKSFGFCIGNSITNSLHKHVVIFYKYTFCKDSLNVITRGKYTHRSKKAISNNNLCNGEKVN